MQRELSSMPARFAWMRWLILAWVGGVRGWVTSRAISPFRPKYSCALTFPN